MHAGDPDRSVHERLRAGDAGGAATEAIRALGPNIFRYLSSVLRDEDDASDAFSRFAERLWITLPGFRGECALRTWAFRLATNAALHVRDEAWRQRRRPLPTSQASALAQDVRTRSAVVRARQHEALERLRRHLTLGEQSLLALRVDQELSWKEIAEVLSSPGAPVDEAAAMKRFERLRAKLQRAAREEGLLV